MKIWLLTTEFPPAFGGGIGTYCYHTSRMLAQNGHEVTIFINDGNETNPEVVITDNGIRIIRFRPGQKEFYRYLGWVAALSYEFSELVELFIETEGKPDIVECQDYLGIGYFLLQKKHTNWPLIKDIRIVTTAHTPHYICDEYNQLPTSILPDYWTGEMEWFSLTASDLVISPSKYLVNELKKYVDLDSKAIAILANPYFNDSSLKTTKRDKNEVIYAGRLEYRKGVVQLLSYFKLLWDEGISLQLKLIGGDTFFYPEQQMMSDYLQKKYKKYFDNGQVLWEGKTSPEQLKNRMAKAGIIFTPSLVENFPYSVIEAMALECIVLASDSGGQSEIIQENINGFLFSHAAPDSFGSKLSTINQLSPKQAQQLGINARNRIDNICSYDVVYSKKMEIFEHLISQSDNRKIFPFIRKPHQTYKNEQKTSTYEKGLISVIIPYYNMKKYIKATLESIISSSYAPIEIIIVNDGSDDPSSVAILYSLEKNYPINVLHKKNEGLALARNTGALHAKGEFIAFLDADDEIDSEYYGWAINILSTYNNVSFVGCWTEYFEEKVGIWPTWNPEPPFLLIHNMVTSGGLVLKRDHFLIHGLNDPKMEYGMEDYESVINMVEHGCKGVVIPKPLYRYRIRAESMSRKFNMYNQLYLYKLIASKHRDLFENYAVDIANLLNSNGPGYLYDNPTFAPPIFEYKNSNMGGAMEINHNRVYLYILLKELFYPLYIRLGGSENIILTSIKNKTKNLLQKYNG